MLRKAVTNLAALPADAHERTVAEQIVVHLEHALGAKPSPNLEEQEFIVNIKGGFEELRIEAQTEVLVRHVLTVLRVRGIAVSERDRKRILAEKDLARLQRWHERVALIPRRLGSGGFRRAEASSLR